MSEQLAKAIQAYFTPSPRGLIAIDGELGAGKTTLANFLASKHGLPVIHLDDFADPFGENYFSSINFDALGSTLKTSRLPVIIEGVCLLKVLDKIGTKPELHFFLLRTEQTPYKKGSLLVQEVKEYISSSNAMQKATNVMKMSGSTTNQLDVDITYLKGKTILAVVLSIGGMIALLVGAFILNAGIDNPESAVFEVLGAKISAKGIGSVIIASSVFWAYFAYLARPKYSRRKEIQRSTAADGSETQYEFESSTMVSAKPGEKPF